MCLVVVLALETMSSLIRRIPSSTLVIGIYVVIIAFALLVSLYSS